MKIKCLRNELTFTLVILSTILQAQPKDTLLVFSEPDYPPFCFVNEQGKPDGFAVEVIKAATEAVELPIELKLGIWNTIKEHLKAGDIDALPFVGRTPERETYFDFSMTYISLHGGIFVRKNDKSIQTLNDLKNKEVVVMKGDNAEEYVLRDNITDKLFTTSTFEEAFELLSSGQYDAIITQRIVGIKLLEQLKIRNVKPLDIKLSDFRQDFCFAVKKGDLRLLDQLNEGLSIIIANDRFKEIRKKWLGSESDEGFTVNEIIRFLLPILIMLLFLLAAAFIFFLRNQVKKETERLNKEIQHHKLTLESLHLQKQELEEGKNWIRLLLDSTGEGIYAIDTTGKCTLINNSALKMLGYSDQKEVLGKNIHQLIHHHYPDGSLYPEEECKVYQAFKQGQNIQVDDEVLFRKDGSSFQAEYFSFPIQAQDEILGSVVTFWDVTESKKTDKELLDLKNRLEQQVQLRTAELEEKVKKLNRSQKAMLFMVEDLNRITSQLKQERRKLEESNHELEAFTYSVSHDLRAPLRAINGFANFLAEDYGAHLDHEGQRYIQTIRKNATKMDSLIGDLLNLSRISRSLLKMQPINMTHLAQEVFDEIATEEEKKQFSLSIKELHSINGDPNLIRQVWVNLISNALKYSSKSPKKKIEIDSKEKEKEVEFSVTDYGAGFNQAYENKLFGIFQRLHRESDYEGVGVGLAIVKRIITRHNGRVWGEGKEDKGAKFFFTINK